MIGSAGEDVFKELFAIEMGLLEDGSERVEQFGIGRWIGIAKIIDRIDNAAGEAVAPNAVGFHFGEVGISGLSEPIDEGRAWIAGGRRGKGANAW